MPSGCRIDGLPHFSASPQSPSRLRIIERISRSRGRIDSGCDMMYSSMLEGFIGFLFVKVPSAGLVDGAHHRVRPVQAASNIAVLTGFPDPRRTASRRTGRPNPACADDCATAIGSSMTAGTTRKTAPTHRNVAPTLDCGVDGVDGSGAADRPPEPKTRFRR